MTNKQKLREHLVLLQIGTFSNDNEIRDIIGKFIAVLDGTHTIEAYRKEVGEYIE